MKSITKIGIWVIFVDLMILGIDVLLILSKSPAAPHWENVINLLVVTLFVSLVTWAIK